MIPVRTPFGRFQVESWPVPLDRGPRVPYYSEKMHAEAIQTIPAEIQTWVASHIVKDDWRYYDELVQRCARDLNRTDVQAYFARLRVSRSVKRSAELFVDQIQAAFQPYIGENAIA